MSIDQALSIIHGVVSAEKEAGRCNSLADLTSRKIRRNTISTLWTQIQDELKQVKTDIDSLPFLPIEEQIAWAQTVVAMHNLRLMEVDTTGLDRADEVVRFTLVAGSGQVTDDFHIRPTERLLSAEVSAKNGVHPTDLEQAPTIDELWWRIRAALQGNYIVSFNQEWDLQRLKDEALRHNLPQLVVVGECLQRRATQYYHKEYYLNLDELAQRAGHPMPEHPAQTSIHRACAQLHVLQAMASAVTDVRPPKPPRTKPDETASSAQAPDDFLSDDSLDSLDEHPF